MSGQKISNKEFLRDFLEKTSVGTIHAYESLGFEYDKTVELKYYLDDELHLRFTDEYEVDYHFGKTTGIETVRYKLYMSGWYPNGTEEWDINNSHVVRYIFSPISNLDLKKPVYIEFVEGTSDYIFMENLHRKGMEQSGDYWYSKSGKFMLKLEKPVAFPHFRVSPFMDYGEHPYDIKLFFGVQNVHRIYQDDDELPWRLENLKGKEK